MAVQSLLATLYQWLSYLCVCIYIYIYIYDLWTYVRWTLINKSWHGLQFTEWKFRAVEVPNTGERCQYQQRNRLAVEYVLYICLVKCEFYTQKLCVYIYIYIHTHTLFLRVELTLNKTNIKDVLYGQPIPLLVLASFSRVWNFNSPEFSLCIYIYVYHPLLLFTEMLSYMFRK